MSGHQEEECLAPELFKQSLFNLGKTFNNARHAYLSLNLASNSLSHVNVSPHTHLPIISYCNCLSFRAFKNTFTCKLSICLVTASPRSHL